MITYSSATTKLAEIQERADNAVRDRDVRYMRIISLMESARDVPQLLAAVEAVPARHQRAGRPTICWDLDLRCAAHALNRPLIPPAEGISMLRDCPDCGNRERFYCTTCREDEWPCGEYRDITTALLGEPGA